MDIPRRTMYARITLDLPKILRQGAYIHLERLFTYIALQRTTQASPRHRWRWACRAVPGGFARAYRAEMEQLVLDIRNNIGGIR